MNAVKKIVAKSLYFMVKIKILQKDFYAAQHQLGRFEYIQAKDYSFYEKIRGFVEGAVCLMKRQYHKAIDLLGNVKVTKFLLPVYHLYKAYGLICLSQYQAAIGEYQKCQLDVGAQYNQVICEGLLEVKKREFGKAYQLMIKASQLLPDKMDPFFYKAVIIIQRDYEQPKIQDCWKQLELAFAAKGKSANLYYVRGMIKAYMRRYTGAINDLDKAIDKSEDNVVDHFYLRGILQAQQMRMKQAIKDFSTCIHFNKDYRQAYLERAKCYQITGEYSSFTPYP